MSEDVRNYVAKLTLLKSFIVSTDSRLDNACRNIFDTRIKLTGFTRPDETLEKESDKLSLDIFHHITLLSIHLFSLKDVYDKFLSKSEDTEIKELVRILEPSLNPIHSDFHLIGDLRNCVFGHGWLFNTDFRGLGDILDSNNMTISQLVERIFFLSKCATIFLDGLLTNLVVHKPFATEILKKSMKSLKTNIEDDYKNATKNSRPILELTKKALKEKYKNSDITFLDNIQNWKVGS